MWARATSWYPPVQMQDGGNSVKVFPREIVYDKHSSLSHFDSFSAYFVKYLEDRDMQLLRIQESAVLKMKMLLFCIYLRK